MTSSRRSRVWLALISALVLLIGLTQPVAAGKRKAKQRRQAHEEQHPEPVLWTYSVVAEYPHDHKAFTQGLQFDRTCDNSSKVCYDIFWESTGLNGQSSIRQVDVNTGEVRLRHDLAANHFGEGVTRLGERLYMITWRTGAGFVFSADKLQMVQEIDTGLGDGWGLTTDGVHLIVSESSQNIHFLDPKTLKEVRTITVKDRGKEIRWMNEMEVVDGELWGNIWQTECIARVNMTTGHVIGWIHMHGLREGLVQRGLVGSQSMDVLNGIAYDATSKRVFVTGKLWPRVFEVVPKPFESGTAPDWAAVARLCHPRVFGLG
ncbi:hypothetical protein HXX76_014995 [Chlamydomonas incerta]|uniref:Glutaminyl-peptide cyclotransferase n=1 Tax=Chlamydomonas incerta TaxID=51695 RepID=A0A835VQB0_CHLIN|nr:hypothetical protein HXX76_014995 [Chlamydomonas incerta]|eukprot:KAG2423835.1 hypothetical protein HXX76_014995 [Chlamydomonas incerta]